MAEFTLYANNSVQSEEARRLLKSLNIKFSDIPDDSDVEPALFVSGIAQPYVGIEEIREYCEFHEESSHVEITH